MIRSPVYHYPARAALALGLIGALGTVTMLGTSCRLSPTAATAIEGATGTACDTFLPLATSALPPPLSTILGPLDVLICAGAQAGVTAALAQATPPAPDGGAPLMASRVEAHRALKQNGKVVALVRGPPWLVEQAQAAMDASGKDGGK